MGLIWPKGYTFKSDEMIEVVQRAWAEIAALTRQSNAAMFESKAMTRDRIQKGDYLEFLEAYWPKLRDWLTRFEKVDSKCELHSPSSV